MIPIEPNIPFECANFLRFRHMNANVVAVTHDCEKERKKNIAAMRLMERDGRRACQAGLHSDKYARQPPLWCYWGSQSEPLFYPSWSFVRVCFSRKDREKIAKKHDEKKTNTTVRTPILKLFGVVAKKNSTVSTL